MKIALMTCDAFPHGDTDDQVLLEAFSVFDVQAQFCVWDADDDWSDYDACLLRSVWDYHKRSEAFNSWLEKVTSLTQLLNPIEVIRWNSRKTYLRDMANTGITIAPTHWLTANQTYDIKQLVSISNADQWFLKPTIGADSIGTCRFKRDAKGFEKARHHLTKWLPKCDMMLQPYLQSVETFGETSAIFIAGQLSHAVRKIPQAGDYRVQDTFGAEDRAYQLTPHELTLAQQSMAYLTAKFGGLLYARLDFLHNANGGVYLNEAELIEPSLFFNHSKTAALTLAKKTLTYIKK